MAARGGAAAAAGRPPRRDGVGVAAVGDTVRVKRHDTGDWATGIVSDVRADGRPLVKLEGQTGRGFAYFEVEVVARAGAEMPPPRPRTATREKLQAFYGLTAEDNELNIDSPQFNAELYAQKLLRERKLTGEGGLLQRDREIEQEVEDLDHELQMLVYDNYKNFINATKLISEMKEKVNGMAGEMTSLAQNMERINSLSDEVRTKLSGNRNEIERLVGINRTLQKIQFLVDLPEKLQELCKRNAFERAVRYWVTGSEILQRYKHVKSFEQVHRQCLDVVAHLLQRLKDALRTPLDARSEKKIGACVKLLRKVAERGTDEERAELEAEMRALLFAGVDERVAQECEGAREATDKATQRRCEAPLPASFGSSAAAAATALAGEGGPEWCVERHADALRESAELLRRALDCLGLPPQQAEDEVKQRLRERFNAAVALEVGHVLRAARCRFEDRLAAAAQRAAADASGPALGDVVAAAVAAVVEDVRALSEAVGALLRHYHNAGSRDTTLAALEQAAQQHYSLFPSLLERLQSAAAVEGVLEGDAAPQRARSLLCSAAVATSIASDMLPPLHVHLRRTFERDIDAGERPGGLPESFREAGRQLAAAAVLLYGQRAGEVARNGMRQLAALPRGYEVLTPGALAEGVCGVVSAAGAFAGVVLPRHEDAPGARDAESASRFSRASRDSRDGASALRSVPPALRSDGGRGVSQLGQEMERVFSSRPAHFCVRPARVSAQAVVDCVAAHSIKSLCETARTATLHGAALQQLQTDALELRLRLPQWARNISALNDALDELVRSAHDRALDPAFLSEEDACAIVFHVPAAALATCAAAVAAQLCAAHRGEQTPATGSFGYPGGVSY